MHWEGNIMADEFRTLDSFLEFLVLLAQEGGEAKEFIGGKIIELTAGELSFEGLSVDVDLGQVCLERGEGLFPMSFAFQRAGGVNFPAEFAVPLDESGPGDVETVGDAGEAQALGAEVHEFVFGVFGVHRGEGIDGLVD